SSILLLFIIDALRLFTFFFSCSCNNRDLHSFPTRRSSDLSSLMASAPILAVNWPGYSFWSSRYFSSGRTSRSRRMATSAGSTTRSEEHTSELQSPCNLVCRLLLEKKKETPGAVTILNDRFV